MRSILGGMYILVCIHPFRPRRGSLPVNAAKQYSPCPSFLTLHFISIRGHLPTRIFHSPPSTMLSTVVCKHASRSKAASQLISCCHPQTHKLNPRRPDLAITVWSLGAIT